MLALIPLLPLLGFVFNATIGRRTSKRVSGGVATGLMFAAFGVSVSVVGRMLGWQNGMPAWYQDLQAWIALLAMLGLGVAIIIHFVINPSLEEKQESIIKLPALEQYLSAVVGFYFGARS